MTAIELADLIRAALGETDSPETFDKAATDRGIELEWSRRGAELVGLKVRAKGSSAWLKASSVNRELSCSKILAVLARNAELRREAADAASAAVGIADARARALADGHTARNEAVNDVKAAPGLPMRALPVAEADAARAMAQAGPDPLQFLVPPVVVPEVLDDADAAVMPPSTAPTEDDEALARKQRGDADADRERLAAELKKMTATQLIELRNIARRPINEAILMAALIERLLQLALKLLSFGGYKRGTPIANLLACKHKVGEAAEAELSRRHRSPSTAHDRMKGLAEVEAALKSRQLEFAAKASITSLSKA